MGTVVVVITTAPEASEFCVRIREWWARPPSCKKWHVAVTVMFH